MLGDEMSDKKIDAETKVHKASEQSIYFFSTLNKLREMHKEEKRIEKRINRNPIYQIKKRIGSQSSMGNGSANPRISSLSSLGNDGSTRSLNSLYSVEVEDDITVDTRGSYGSRGSRGSRGSKSATKVITKVMVKTKN
ncbi:MAG: hypothetical protein ACI8RD_004818 [Bacillariaceae sp.]|jgi:hypothetical protein